MKKSFLLTLAFLLSLSISVFSQKNFPGGIEYETSETAKKADRKINADDIDGAIEVLDKAIEKKKDLFEAYRKRSSIRELYKNDIDGAIADLDKALEIKPDDLHTYISRASLKKKYKKDFAGALKDYETAQKYHPDSMSLYTHKASVKAELKDFDGAIAEIQAALKAYPQNINLHISLSDLLTRKNEPDKAIAHLQNFLGDYAKQRNGKLPKIRGEKVIKKIPREFEDSDNALNPLPPVKRYSQMSVNANPGKDPKSQLMEMDEARQLSRAFLVLGKMLLSKNAIDEALSKLDTAIEIYKNQEEAYALRGAIYLTQGKIEPAITEFDRAIDIADEPSFYLNRGFAYLIMGNNRKSQMDFEKFIEIYPEGQEILKERIAEAKKLQINNK